MQAGRNTQRGECQHGMLLRMGVSVGGDAAVC